MSSRKVQFRASDEDAGRRLDQVLAARVPELSRRKARVLLDIGGVFVDRARVKVASRKVRPGQLVEAHLGGALERASKRLGRAARQRDARSLPGYRIIFEDDEVAVVDKPAGLLAAPTPESDRNNLADLLRRDGRPELFVVHRIDLHTSGLVVFARSDRANKHLAARFREHDVEREYVAVVDGAVADPAQTVRAPVKGRPAVTHLRVERVHPARAATVLRARLETGRTHQIRIHCSLIGHPVLGDRRYGHRTAHDPPRMALHAAVLGFAHPRTGEPVRFDSPVPEDLAAWMAPWSTRGGSPGAAQDARRGEQEE